MPYPGARPEYSFIEWDGHCLRVEASDDGWVVGDVPLDDWLMANAAAPTARRRPVLAYGSNACPAKISWLRAEHGLTGPVVVLRARCTGLAAVWAAGRRVVDDQRPATLCALTDVVEEHAVWLAADDQFAALDACEGRGVRYRLARVHTGRVELADGSGLDAPLAYVGLAAQRMPLLVDGRPVRCADTTQAHAMSLTGTSAATDGLDVTVLPGP
ncbi:gamma-glutamylcyclotransferase [uncultured Jatrophihabitans sp.]|uniref:gamma-glutamylcyclotransferase n=1 Tax=uncultured Jatrophihabitans sp. TaxID=1610747 RepID=UPI0035C95D55